MANNQLGKDEFLDWYKWREIWKTYKPQRITKKQLNEKLIELEEINKHTLKIIYYQINKRAQIIELRKQIVKMFDNNVTLKKYYYPIFERLKKTELEWLNDFENKETEMIKKLNDELRKYNSARKELNI